MPHGHAASSFPVVDQPLKVVGDDGEDIFDWLAITHEGHTFVWHNYVDRPRYVPADQVASIDEGQVTLPITADEAHSLPLHDPPESARVEPEDGSRTERFETWFEHKTGEDRTE
jgi:hypothetical protein